VNGSSLYRVLVSVTGTPNPPTPPCAAGSPVHTVTELVAGAPPVEVWVYDNAWEHRANVAPYVPAGGSVGWAGFAFSQGQTATVTVIAAFPIAACVLRPRSYGIQCTQANSTTVSFVVTQPMRKVSVELWNDDVGNTAAYIKRPLFVWADPPENGSLVANPADPSAIIYGPGYHVHDLNVNGMAPQRPIGSTAFDAAVYVHPGAYLVGGFIVCRGCRAAVTGRGVMSGEAWPWHSDQFQWGLINVDYGWGQVSRGRCVLHHANRLDPHSSPVPLSTAHMQHVVIDGLTLVDSPMFYIASVSPGTTIRNVKMASAWPYNSDGLDVPTAGLVEDVFIRSNDDSIKLSGSNSLARRLVVWQMVNGASVQMGWVSSFARENVTVDDVDIIHVDYCSLTTQGGAQSCAMSDNEATVGSTPDGMTSVQLSNVTVSNLRVEGDAVRVMYVAMPPASTPDSYLTSLRLVNVSADAMSLARAHGGEDNVIAGASGALPARGVTLDNVTIAGNCINASAAVQQWGFRISDAVATLFQCPPDAL